MVKNTKGGSGHKSMARKHTDESSSKKTRISLDELEIYACVTGLLGGTNCSVKCVDGTSRLCVIRGKFRGGRGKRSNMLVAGTWVLVGAREWSGDASSDKEANQCDLLEVYNDSDKQELRKIRGVKWELLDMNVFKTQDQSDDNFEFTNENYQEDLNELLAGGGKNEKIDIKLVKGNNNDEDDESEEGFVDVDDI